jgi:succinoglycan biosynthesis protein ExoA
MRREAYKSSDIHLANVVRCYCSRTLGKIQLMLAASNEHPGLIDDFIDAPAVQISTRLMISAIVAVRNEERHIESVVHSLLQQDVPDFDLELIIVDGDSCDATRDIVSRVTAKDSRVKLIINKHRKTPYAFNLGLDNARGEYVCILGAHTIYAKNYIAACLDQLKRRGAAGCSGRERVCAGGEGLQARLIAWALAHPFGTSTGSTRTRGAGFADSVPYPVFLKGALIEAGGYDTQLHRNQDNDICQKIRSRGRTLYITNETSCEYFVSPDLLSLSRYAFRTGFWNFISLKVNRASMAPRHFVPAVFAAAALISLLTFGFSFSATGNAQLLLRGFLLLLAATYGIASLAAACHIAFRQRSAQALLLPFSFVILHLSYGIGTLTAMVRNARAPVSEMS